MEDYLVIPDHPNYIIQSGPPFTIINTVTEWTLTILYHRDYAYVTINNSKIYLHTLIAR